jgi:hypothetical protein
MTAPVTTVTDNRQSRSGLAGFAGATIALIVVAGGFLAFAFRGPGDLRAVIVSGIVAAVVQISAFPAVQRLASRNMMLGWGMGSALRLLSLAAYALLAGTVLALPLTAALISLFVFYFLSMLIEPLFLRVPQ